MKPYITPGEILQQEYLLPMGISQAAVAHDSGLDVETE